MIDVVNDLSDKGLSVGVALVRGVRVAPASPELAAAMQSLIAARKAVDEAAPGRKDEVRALLRAGGFKPSGRSKPASEYLAQAAREERFPAINNLVDALNLVSLQSGLPISLLDADAVGQHLRLRFGRAGERYVFNSGGQEIDLKGLVCACAGGPRDEPLGNPVKDSLKGKIGDLTTSVLAVIYCPAGGSARTELAAHLAALAGWLEREGRAASVDTALVD